MKRKKDTAPAVPGPTVQDVNDLFDELIPNGRYDLERIWEIDPEYLKAQAAVEEREKEIEQDAKLKQLKAKVKTAKNNAIARAHANKEKCEKVRREYRAKGLTPEVAKKIAKLVDEVNRS